MERKSVHMRLLLETIRLRDKIARRQGMTKTGVVDIAVREFAERREREEAVRIWPELAPASGGEPDND